MPNKKEKKHHPSNCPLRDKDKYTFGCTKCLPHKYNSKCQHLNDYDTLNSEYENESIYVEHVKCHDCGRKGTRTFHIDHEEWD